MKKSKTREAYALTEEEMQLVKKEAYKRFYNSEQYGERKAANPGEMALRCIGEAVLCKAIGVEWGGALSATLAGDFVVKAAKEHWHGLLIPVNSIIYDAVYVLVSPTYRNPMEYAVHWIDGESVLANASKYLKKNGEVFIIPQDKLFGVTKLREMFNG